MMKNEDEVEGGIEVEAPRAFPNEEVEEEVEGGRRNDTYVENVNGVPQPKTWYSRTIGKVAILFVAVFAVCVAIGYGSGYGINEKIHSNKAAAAASVSSAKNGAYETYDTPSSDSKTSKVAKSTGPTDTKSSKADGSTKSSKSGGCVSDTLPVAEGGVCCASGDCESIPSNCEIALSVCRPPVLIPDGELDCSGATPCNISDDCSNGGEFCYAVLLEQCTVESRPSSGTCVDPCRLLAEEPIEEDVPIHRRKLC